MVATLNFGLLQPLDLNGAVAAFDQSRSRRMQQQQIDTEGQRVQAMIAAEQRKTDEAARAKAAKQAAARFLILGGGIGNDTPGLPPTMPGGGTPGIVPTEAPQMAAAPATAPMQPVQASLPMSAPQAPVAADMSAPVVDEPMATVSAPRVNPIWEQLIDSDPEQAIALFEKSKQMTDDERKRVSDSYGMLAAATVDLGKVPYEQRRAALAQMAPMLEAQGVPRSLIENFDPTDTNLSAAANNALGLKEVFAIRDRAADNNRAERALNETINNNRVQQSQGAQRIQLQADGNAISAGNATKTVKRDEANLRKEFQARPEVKEYQDVANSYRQIYAQASRPNPTAQNDMAIIFSYMKMLDPGSVVREGEFANAQNATGIPEQVRNLYNRAASGNRLNAEQRNNMLLSAADVVKSRQGRVQSVVNEFRGYASDYGADPDRVAKFDRVFAPKPAGGGASGGGTPRIKTDAEWQALKSGTVYIDPNGKRRTKQ